jgi:hypothetical protein
VEVLLRLLTHQEDLVLLYLRSESFTSCIHISIIQVGLRLAKRNTHVLVAKNIMFPRTYEKRCNKTWGNKNGGTSRGTNGMYPEMNWLIFFKKLSVVT